MDEAAPYLDDEALIDAALAEAAGEAEARRTARIEQIHEQLRAHAQDLRRNRYERIPYEELITAAQFVAAAVASGVVGNLAYDLLRRARAATRARSKTRPARPDHALADLALHAVREQCRRFDLEAPPLGDMRVDRWSHTEHGAVAHVSCRRSELTATVTVPFRDREGRGVEVRVRDVSQRQGVERVAAEQHRKLVAFRQWDKQRQAEGFLLMEEWMKSGGQGRLPGKD